MKDLVSVIEDQDSMLKAGFDMISEDDVESGEDKKYSKRGISEYTRIISSNNPGYVLGRKI